MQSRQVPGNAGKGSVLDRAKEAWGWTGLSNFLKHCDRTKEDGCVGVGETGRASARASGTLFDSSFEQTKATKDPLRGRDQADRVPQGSGELLRTLVGMK